MNKPLRFCMVTTFYPPYHFGGDGTFIYRLSNGLARRGHSVDVIHCLDAYHSLESSEPRASYPNHPNVTVHRLKSKAGILSPLLTQQTGYPWFKGAKIKRIIEGGQFDVVHYHNISLVGGPKILEYGDAIKLYTMHEYWLVCPMHVLFKGNQEACVKPSCFTCTLAHKRPPQFWRYTGMINRSTKSVDAFISPSRFVGEMHKTRGLEIPTVQIPLFVPKPPEVVFAAESLKRWVNPDRPYFLFVGRLEKIKGLQDVIPIFREYKHADLVIVGTGTYQRQLQDLAAGNERVKFLGALPYEDLSILYSKALAVIVPSLCYETFGQIVIEAFSLKTPVIVKDIGALRELVTESGGGLLYRQDSELIESLEALRLDSDLRKECSQRGHDTYLQRWTEDRYFAEYFKLIADIEETKCKSGSESNGPIRHNVVTQGV